MSLRLESEMMKINHRKVLISLLFFCISLLVLLASDAVSDHFSPEELGGEAFSDPSMIQEMGEEWQKKGIIYNTADGDADLVVLLDQNMFPALSPIVEKYAEEKGLKIIIKEGTCGLSAGRLSKKSVDVGGYCCAPGRTDRLPGLRFHTIGISSVALIVHPDNPVDNISLEEARHIFMGDIHSWTQLIPEGGESSYPLSIQPVGRLHCKIRAGHWRLLLDNEDLFSPGLQEVGAIPDMISQVSSRKRVIGFETLWMTRRFLSRGTVKALSLDGYDPDDAPALMSGKYPLYRVYSITTWEGEEAGNPHAAALVDYVLKNAEHLDSRYSLVPAFSLREAGWRFNGNELVGEPGDQEEK